MTEFAVERARLLLGCFRTGEANDPETYVAAVAATLAHFEEAVIAEVTNPTISPLTTKSWLPSVGDIRQACEQIAEPIIQQRLREKRIAEQLATREAEDAAPKPTLEELHAKYGKDWGLNPSGVSAKQSSPARSWEEVVRMYQSDPSMLGRLVNTDRTIEREKRARGE